MRITAVLLAGAIMLAPLQASAQVCGVGLIAAALTANLKENPQLTEKEARTCGLLLGNDRANEKPATAKKDPKPS
jgi:hypothetical protein